MDIERDLRAHLVVRADGPLPADLTARLASRISSRPSAGRWVVRGDVRRPFFLGAGSLAAVLVAAVLLSNAVAPPRPAASSLVESPGSSPLVASPASLAPTGTVSSASPSVSPPSTPPSAYLAHPTGATDVILSLRCDRGNGGIPITKSMRVLLTDTVFVLYGDGTAIYGPSPYRRGALLQGPARYQRYISKLDPGQVDALLRFALDGSHLRDADGVYTENVVPSSNSIFTVDADGIDRSLWVGPVPVSRAPPTAERSIWTSLQKLVTFFQTFEDSAVVQATGGPKVYRADAYLAVLDDERSVVSVDGGWPKGLKLGRWPWPDIAPSAFHGSGSAAQTLVVSPADFDALKALRTFLYNGIAVHGPDGAKYLISIRPMLPGEVAP